MSQAGSGGVNRILCNAQGRLLSISSANAPLSRWFAAASGEAGHND
jgi:hypothetical protein